MVAGSTAIQIVTTEELKKPIDHSIFGVRNITCLKCYKNFPAAGR